MWKSSWFISHKYTCRWGIQCWQLSPEAPCLGGFASSWCSAATESKVGAGRVRESIYPKQLTILSNLVLSPAQRLISPHTSWPQRELGLIRKRVKAPPPAPHSRHTLLTLILPTERTPHAAEGGCSSVGPFQDGEWWSLVYENQPFCSIISFRVTHLYLCVCVYTNMPTYKDEASRRSGKKLCKATAHGFLGPCAPSGYGRSLL